MKAASGSSLIHRAVVTDNLEIPQNQVSLRVSWVAPYDKPIMLAMGLIVGS